MNLKVCCIDTNRMDYYTLIDGYCVINLNALLKNKHLDKADLQDKLNRLPVKNWNLCNLASYCNRVEIKYGSEQCFEILDNLVRFINKLYPDKVYFQNNLTNGLEVDCRPFSKLYEIDETNATIYISKILRNNLRFLGYTDSQIGVLAQELKDISQIVPMDLDRFTAWETNETNHLYEQMKELITC